MPIEYTETKILLKNNIMSKKNDFERLVLGIYKALPTDLKVKALENADLEDGEFKNDLEKKLKEEIENKKE